MNRRDMIALAALGLIGCATGKATKPPVEPSPSPVPELKCIVCGIKLDHYNWYGDEGPFCDPHLEERMAKDRPKRGLMSGYAIDNHRHYGWKIMGSWSA